MKHRRIDEGIKRKAARFQHPRDRSRKADLGSWNIPPDLDPKEVIERYLSEATTSQIAGQYGVSRKALTKWLRTTLPLEWRQAQVLRALCRKDDADEGMDGACDAFTLARAREQLRSAQFDLQALDNDFRPKQEVTVDDKRDLGDRLRRAKEREIEGTHTTITSSDESAVTQHLVTKPA